MNIHDQMREENLAHQHAVRDLRVYACRFSSRGITEFVVARTQTEAREARPDADAVRAATHDELKIIALRALTGNH